VLVIVDDFSSYIVLYPCDSPTAANTVKGLLKWFSFFGVVLLWGSDRGSHFLNQAMTQMRQLLRADHHFVVPYAPFANGLAERGVKGITNIFATLLSEFRLEPADWPQLADVVQAAHNTTKSPSRGMSPLELHTGIQPVHPLDAVVHFHRDHPLGVLAQPLSSERLQQLGLELQAALREKHEAVSKHLTILRARARKRHEEMMKGPLGAQHRRETAISAALNYDGLFCPGVYVVVATVSAHSKLRGVWQGPFQVLAEVSTHVYTVRHLVTRKESEVHACRMRYYADQHLNVSTQLLAQIRHDEAKWEVSHFLDLREDSDATQWYIHTSWRGFDDLEATWEPLRTMYRDIPQAVERFLDARAQLPAHRAMVAAASAFLQRLARSSRPSRPRSR
jgi:transposase InsO family protein